MVASLRHPAAGNTIVVAEITRVDVAAALAARHRASAGVTRDERDRLVGLLLQHFDTEYQIALMNTMTVSCTVVLTQNHRLRGYDAVQLATGLNVNTQYLAAGLPNLTFIAADDDFVAAAQAERLTADNPNLHP